MKLSKVFLLFFILIAISGQTTLYGEEHNFKYETINGEKIRYLQKGNGQDILLIHGLPGSIEDWDPIFDKLAEKYRVTAYDRPGFGYSTGEYRKHTIEDNAITALKVIQKLKLKNVIVVGHSYGGGTTINLATKNLKGIKAYISIAGVSFHKLKPNLLYNILLLPGIGRFLADIFIPKVGNKLVETGLKEAFEPNLEYMTEKIVNKRKKIWLNTKVIMSMVKEHKNIGKDTKEMAKLYKNIVKPLYIIQGTDDKLVPASESIKLHNIVKKSKFILLKHTCHMVQYIHPKVILNVIDTAAKNEK